MIQALKVETKKFPKRSQGNGNKNWKKSINTLKKSNKKQVSGGDGSRLET